jgi:hypothetical protein
MYIKGHIYEKATNKRRTKPTDSRQLNIAWTSAGACPEQQQPKKTSPSLTLSMNGTPCTVQTERPQRENNVPVDIHLPPAETAATTPVTIHAEMHDWPEKTATAPGLLWPVSFGGLGLPSGFCGNLDPRLNRESCDTKLNWAPPVPLRRHWRQRQTITASSARKADRIYGQRGTQRQFQEVGDEI